MFWRKFVAIAFINIFEIQIPCRIIKCMWVISNRVKPKNLHIPILFLKQIAQEAEQIFFQNTLKSIQYQPLEPQNVTHEEIIFQVPIQGTNISVIQPGSADQMVNYTSITHPIPSGQTENYICSVDAATPLLILTPVTPLNDPMSTNNIASTAPVIEIPLHCDIPNDVSGLN